MKLARKMLPSLALALALLVAGCGDSDSSSAPVANPADRAFVADMIPHHEAAVQMAQVARRRASSEFVTKLADNIIETQNTEIATMRAADQRLRTAGIAKGSLGVPQDMMGMDHDAASLKTAQPFDRAFLQMMIPHHEGAVTMAKAEIAKGKDTELKALAEEIITAQRREITEMRKHLAGGAGSEHEGDGTHG